MRSTELHNDGREEPPESRRYDIDEWTNETLSSFPVYCQFRTNELFQPHFHSHSGYELYLCLQGSGNYIAGERLHELGPGTWTAVRPMALHVSRPDRQLPFHRYVLAVEKSYLEDLTEGDPAIGSWVGQWLPEEGSDSLHAQLNGKQMLQAQELCGQLEREIEGRQPGFQLAVRSLLLQLFMQLGRSSTDSGRVPHVSGERKRLVEGILGYMMEHYQEPLRTEELCSRFHLSRSYLHRIFKQDTGCSVNEFLIAYRINKSRELLQSGDMPVTEVAASVGFQDISHFCHTFKRLTKMTPSGYRSAHAERSP